MDKELHILGKKIAELRKKRNLTQEKLAELTGYSTNHISKLELARTRPSFELLVGVANALNVDLRELFSCKKEDKTPIEFKQELIKLIHQTKMNKIPIMYKICMLLSEDDINY